MIRVGIVGATGYAGAELVRILSGHPDVELAVLTSRQYAGVPFEEIYPAMSGIVGLVCEEYEQDSFCDKVDFAFTAVPHKIPMKLIPGLIDRGIKVVDLSADFRFNDVLKYEEHYQPHTAKDLVDKSVYGLCEVYHKKVKNASLVGNPGCYPTSLILPLAPLIKSGIIDTNTIISDSKSGVSGAGRSVSLTTHFCEVNESFKAYKVAEHRHNPEMEEVLSDIAERQVLITFVPHLIPISRGMLTTVYATLNNDSSPDEIRSCLTSFYKESPFVRICPENIMPNISSVRGTNYCDIGFTIDKRVNRIILVSVIDNLVKGAAGQAVQNMNIMLGLKETKGLDNVPFPI
ncbi:MAG: N-acetyl-gamma-glutamyl-phosphate reductase [Desulfobacterales bacterium]|nr:N-acetyl-gamma-glutamyl-phosphate reductase [Desulfobacterales bacterium]